MTDPITNDVRANAMDVMLAPLFATVRALFLGGPLHGEIVDVELAPAAAEVQDAVEAAPQSYVDVTTAVTYTKRVMRMNLSDPETGAVHENAWRLLTYIPPELADTNVAPALFGDAAARHMFQCLGTETRSDTPQVDGSASPTLGRPVQRASGLVLPGDPGFGRG